MIIQKGSDLTLTIDSNATKIRVFTTNRNVYIEKTVTNYSDLILNFIGTEYTNYYYKDADLNKTLIETLDANISLITSDIKTKLDKLTAGTASENYTAISNAVTKLGKTYNKNWYWGSTFASLDVSGSYVHHLGFYSGSQFWYDYDYDGVFACIDI